MSEMGSYPEHGGVTDNLRGSRQASWRRWHWDCVTRRDRGEGQESRKDTRLIKALVAAPGSAELSPSLGSSEVAFWSSASYDPVCLSKSIRARNVRPERCVGGDMEAQRG